MAMAGGLQRVAQVRQRRGLGCRAYLHWWGPRAAFSTKPFVARRTVLLVGNGLRQRFADQRLQFGRFAAAPGRFEHGNIGQLLPGLNTPEHKPTTAHVSAADELSRKDQLSAKNIQQRVYVFWGCDAAQEDDLAVRA